MKFQLGTLLQSLVKKLVGLVVAFVAGPAVAPVLAGFGITIDPTQLTVALYGLIEAARAWLTHQPWWEKVPGWLKALL